MVILVLFIISLILLGVVTTAYIHARRRVIDFAATTEKHAGEIEALQKKEDTLLSELTSLKDQLDNAIKDPITGLVGWQLFDDRLNVAIKESERYQFTMGLLVIDIDDFSMINDALGHEVGDALLKELSSRLQECIRQVDSLTRINKDAFVILLNQLTKPEAAAVIAQRILQSLGKPFILPTHEIYLTACIGISIYPTDAADGGALLNHAMEALEVAKHKDKQAFQFYQEKMHLNSQRELTIYTGLKRESLYQELELYFHPIINTKDETIFSMDALLFWQPVGIEKLNPDELFHYAERQRVINNLSEWLIATACKKFLHWQSVGFTPHYLGIPITFSQLENRTFIYRLSQIMQEINFDPKKLLLQVKDNKAQQKTPEIEAAFNMLKYLGAKIAIDNFGDGFFSIAQLKNFPVDYLKLHSLLTENVHSEKTVTIIRSLSLLAQGLSCQLIIQNVNTDEEIKAFNELDCYLMQGHSLSAPMVESDVISKMAT